VVGGGEVVLAALGLYVGGTCCSSKTCHPAKRKRAGTQTTGKGDKVSQVFYQCFAASKFAHTQIHTSEMPFNFLFFVVLG